MNLYVVYRRDREDGLAPAIRSESRAAHRAYMDAFAARVRLGGPVLDEEGRPCGGLMVIEAESLGEVQEMVRLDPFELAGLSGSIEIRAFRWQTQRPHDLPAL